MFRWPEKIPRQAVLDSLVFYRPFSLVKPCGKIVIFLEIVGIFWILWQLFLHADDKATKR